MTSLIQKKKIRVHHAVLNEIACLDSKTAESNVMRVTKNYVEVENGLELAKVLGLPPSAAYRAQMRYELTVAIRKLLKKKKWTHAQAAKKAGVGRTVITAIVNFHVQSVSVERLVDVAFNLGLHVELKVA